MLQVLVRVLFRVRSRSKQGKTQTHTHTHLPLRLGWIGFGLGWIGLFCWVGLGGWVGWWAVCFASLAGGFGLQLACLLACWLGLAWLGLVWFGLVWFGLVWFGLVWFGLVWLVHVFGWLVGLVELVWLSWCRIKEAARGRGDT